MSEQSDQAEGYLAQAQAIQDRLVAESGTLSTADYLDLSKQRDDLQDQAAELIP